jgi:hypothetical protein
MAGLGEWPLLARRAAELGAVEIGGWASRRSAIGRSLRLGVWLGSPHLLTLFLLPALEIE